MGKSNKIFITYIGAIVFAKLRKDMIVHTNKTKLVFAPCLYIQKQI